MTGNLVNKALVKGYKGRPFQPQFKQEWLQVKLTSQAGTGHEKTWIRHQNDPPVVIMLEDEMLPDKYENKEVLWIETEAHHKVWPYSSRSWKRLRHPNDFPLSKFDPKRPGLWHRQMPGEPPKALQTSSKKKKKAA